MYILIIIYELYSQQLNNFPIKPCSWIDGYNICTEEASFTPRTLVYTRGCGTTMCQTNCTVTMQDCISAMIVSQKVSENEIFIRDGTQRF